MSRNSANLTYTYYSEDGSIMEDPKCHKCMNRRFHEHALHDVSTVYVNTLAGPIPFLIRSLIFSNGDEKPFTLRSIHENLVVLKCTDQFHSSGDDSAKNAIKISNSATILPKESGLENFPVSTRKRKADEPEVVKEAFSPSSSIYKKPCKLRQWEPVDSATRVVADHDGFGKTLVASADSAVNTASSVHKSELLVTEPSQKFTLFRGKPKNESKELSMKECAEQFFANFYANGLFSGGLTHRGKSVASSPSLDKCNNNFENFKFVPNVNVADEKTKPTRLTSDNKNSTNVLCSNIVSETKLQTLSERLQKFNTSGIFSSSLIDRVKSAACSQSVDECNYNIEKFKFISNANVFAAEQAKNIRLASEDANSTNLTEMCPTSIDAVPSPKSTECREMMQPVAYKVTDSYMLKDAIKTVSEPTEYANECRTETVIYPSSSVDVLTTEQFSQSNQKLQPEVLKPLESATPSKKSDGLCKGQQNRSIKMLQIEGPNPNINKSVDLTRIESTFSANANECAAVPFPISNLCTEKASVIDVDPSELARIPLSEESRHRVQPRFKDDIVARDIKEFPTTAEKKYECLPDANKCSAVPATSSTLSYALKTTNDVKVQSPKLASVAPPQGSSLCHQDDFEDVLFVCVLNKCSAPSVDDRSQMESNLQCMNHLSKSDVQSRDVDQSRPLAFMRLASPITGGFNEKLPPNRRSSATRRSLNRCETVEPVKFPFVFGRNRSDVTDVITDEIYKKTVQPFLSKLSDGFVNLLADKFTSPELRSCRHCVDVKLFSPANALRHFLSKKHFTSTYSDGFVFSFSRDFIKLTEICKENGIKKNTKVTEKIPFVGGYLPVFCSKIPFAKIYNMIMCLKTRGVLTPSFENYVLQKFPRIKNITRCSHCNLSLPSGDGCSYYFSHFLTIEHIVKAMENLYDCTTDWCVFTSLLKNYSEEIGQPRIYAEIKEDVKSGLYSKSSETYAGFAAQLKSTKK